MEGILGSVGNITFFDKTSKNLIANGKALTTEGLDISGTLDLIRGGMLNGVQGTLFHTTQFTVNAESATFDLQYMALNCGGQIEANGDVFKVEQVTVGANGEIAFSDIPKALDGEGTNVYAWYRKQDETTYTVFKVNNPSTKKQTVSGLAQGTVVCVKYLYNLASARTFKVSSAFIPSIVHAVLTIPIFATGSSNSTANSAQIGELIVDIPNYTFNGAQSYSLTAGGASTAPLSGTALITYGGGSCDDKGYYGKITENMFNKDEFANVTAIVVADGGIRVGTSAPNNTYTLQVMALYNDGTLPSLIDNSKLTFTSKDTAKATVAGTGIVTGVANGSTDIEVKVTGKTSLTCYAYVTVD